MTSTDFDFSLNDNNVDQERPLLYLWEVFDGSGCLLHSYVGKAIRGSGRPLRHYRRNVRNLLQNKPYRKGKADKYRLSHHALAEATKNGHKIVLTLLRNVEETTLSAAERQEIMIRKPDLNRI